MSPQLPSAAVPAPATRNPVPPGLIALFAAFAKISLSGFGGVLVFARRAIVDEHRWMSAEEFNETYALCHFLPGPNATHPVGGVGRGFRGRPRWPRRFRRTGRPADGAGDRHSRAVCAFRRG